MKLKMRNVNKTCLQSSSNFIILLIAFRGTSVVKSEETLCFLAGVFSDFSIVPPQYLQGERLLTFLQQKFRRRKGTFCSDCSCSPSYFTSWRRGRGETSFFKKLRFLKCRRHSKLESTMNSLPKFLP